jgi:eukaryotic-like serine/threonine-protein kinase
LDSSSAPGVPAPLEAAPSLPAVAPQQLALPSFVPPSPGETIVSNLTGTTYTIGDQVGAGNFGIVWHCTDPFGTDQVVKVLKPLQPLQHLRERGLAEVQKAFFLRHPNITYVYDFFEYRETMHIVYERCGSPLDSLFGLQNFSGAIWMPAIARCVLRALGFMHSNNFVHQDLHLRNVLIAWAKDEMLLDQPGSISFKVADLGLAKLAHEMDAQNTVLADWIRAPEAFDVAQFGPMDHRMDLYHAGLLFLQVMLGKEVRFTKDEVMEGQPRKIAEQLPPPFGPAIAMALRRHAAHRHPNALQFWQAMCPPKLPAPMMGWNQPRVA